MLILHTGLPGAGKTLNTVYEVCQDNTKQFRDRPIYYNNISLMLLDMEVCSSFAAYAYHVIPKIDLYRPDQLKAFNSQLLAIRSNGRFATVDDFPSLKAVYESWLLDNGAVDLWLASVRRAYPANRLKKLDDLLLLSPDAGFDELKSLNLHWSVLDDPTEWFTLPRLSVVILDECQRFFPPRKLGSPVPRHVSEFETHRHLAISLILITQNAGLLDHHVRKLVNRHVNYINPLAGSRIVRYEWDSVQDSIDYHAKNGGIKSHLSRPKQMFGLYHSADAFTHKMRLPKKVIYLGVLAVAVVSLLIYMPFHFTGGDSDDLDGSVASTSQSGQSAAGSPSRQEVKISPSNPIATCTKLRFGGYNYSSKSGLTYYVSCEFVEQVDDAEVVKYESYSSDVLALYGYYLVDVGRVITLYNGDSPVLHFDKFY